MITRYVTYDIKDGNSYNDLYVFLDSVNGEQLTESTYKTVSTYDFDFFCSALKESTSKGDSVVILYINKNKEISHKVIR